MSTSMPTPPGPPQTGSVVDASSRPASHGLTFGSPTHRTTRHPSWLFPVAAFVAGAVMSGTLVSVISPGTGEAYDESSRSLVTDAFRPPPAAWYDPQVACDQVRSLEVSYGQSDPSGLPFSENLWLNQLVNATEMAGAANSGSEGPDIPQGDRELAYVADKLRFVIIGDGISNPLFPGYLVDFLDICDRYFP